MDSVKPIVLYSTKSGNTRKIADEIASELRCESLRISQANSMAVKDLNDFDLVFIGTGIRFGNPNEDMVRYLRTIELKRPRSFALFITWGGTGITNQEVIAKLKMILESKGQKVIDDYFLCFGGRQFSLLRRGHPNDEDIKAARTWGKRIVNSIL